MPDDSSGIYSVPAGTIVSTGDTILPSQHNPWANDSASAISARFSKDGRAPATGNWNINNFRLNNVGAPVAGGDAVNKTYADGLGSDKLNILQPSVDIASAATTDIGALASQNVRVTGTTTITSFGTASAGTFRRVLFSGTLTLTHNATSLILFGSNITTADGDIAEFISEGSGNWRCVDYNRATGPYGNITVSAAIAATSGTSIDFTSIPSWAKRVTVTLSGVSLSGPAGLLVQIGSGSFVTSGYASASNATNGTAFSSAAGIAIAAGGAASTNITTLVLYQVSTNTWMSSHQGALSGTTLGVVGGSSGLALSGALDRVRITSSSGTDTFDAGSITVMWE